jgi:hypothetical protein
MFNRLSTLIPVRSAIWPLLACFFVTSPCLAGSPIGPDTKKTPGDVLTTDIKVICVPGYTKTVRNVPEAIKKQVFRLYGITSKKPKEYEVDHLISLELGGSNSIRNLWPESYVTLPLNAHVKDDLENKLHKLICNGKLPIETAQQEIAQDWVSAYQKYVGPLPGGGQTIIAGSTNGDKANGVSGQQAPFNLPENSPIDQPDKRGNCTLSSPIKVSKGGTYYSLAYASYKRIKAKQCFPTIEAAHAAGFHAPKR